MLFYKKGQHASFEKLGIASLKRLIQDPAVVGAGLGGISGANLDNENRLRGALIGALGGGAFGAVAPRIFDKFHSAGANQYYGQYADETDEFIQMMEKLRQ